MSEKIQKVLARAGIGSRREIEKWIENGQVTINGKPAKLGDRIELTARVLVDGKRIRLNVPAARILLYHKPTGEICTRHDPEGRPTVFDNLPNLHHGRWVCVGRLDINASGLLIITTDGEFAARLMHPRYEIEREYAVRVLGKATPQQINQLLKGVDLDDGMAAFSKIEEAGGSGVNNWYRVTLKEGRYREVRRMWQSQGLVVNRLIRVRYGEFTLPRGLKMGEWLEIDRRYREEYEPSNVPKHRRNASAPFSSQPKNSEERKKPAFSKSSASRAEKQNFSNTTFPQTAKKNFKIKKDGPKSSRRK